MSAPAGTGLHEPCVDSARFRQVLGRFCSGVTIITGLADGGTEPAGLTCQSFFSLSLDPPLVAVSVSRTSGSWLRIAPSKAFCVNVLSTDQQRLGRSFAVSGADKFAGRTGSPRQPPDHRRCPARSPGSTVPWKRCTPAATTGW
ncbi:hypothetical protein SHKM778_32550 [Streptomyces sp. KM77-8]|uniref:Flavin reductase like domain-containing protein n=1 Tax=Streptomyces haneummycinicus TaxID=3074435 RepID=A0AAT9HHH8_9ACTN